jgi:hypothetical protein
MSVAELKKASSKKSNVTTRAIGYRAAKIKSSYGPISDEVAYGIVAQLSGVDVSKIISDPLILDQIRNQLVRIAESESDSPKSKTKTVVKTKVVEIAKDLKLDDPILDDKLITDAKEMTVHYAQLYLLENSVREVINRVLIKHIGPGWWHSKNVRKELLNKVQGRIDKEKENPWHGRRGAHPIYYTDISDLIYLLKRHWKYFEDIFPRLEWVSEKLEQVSFSRNVVDHHNPLGKRDRDRLTLNLQDWQDQIKANKDNL